ncbi:MAG TPA: DUF805 domain-containing protein [Bryobacteraceae bacterium]|nr:DUF805 domain-containing protein [Bryobacteraceae bacterium]
MNWYVDVLKKYAEFKGRARRKEYWMFALFNIIISFVIGFVAGLLASLAGVPALGQLSLLYSLAILVPSIAVGVRRMHDTGHSGWWLLCPIVNLVFACTDSQPGPNEYGPNPKMA